VQLRERSEETHARGAQYEEPFFRVDRRALDTAAAAVEARAVFSGGEGF